MAFKSVPLLILALVTITCITAFTDNAMDCCLITSYKPIPSRIVKSYIHQTAGSGCQIPATQFVTAKGKRLCAPPPGDNDWVAKLIKKVKDRQVN